MADQDERTAADATRRWVTDLVIGLNLCPFARRVAEAGRVRYTVTPATDTEELLAALGDELRLLAAAPRAEVETTLLIHPHTLSAFPDYNDFLPEADRLVRRLGLQGVIQVAGFHPDYQFAGTPPDAVENYTNRSPHPMLHLLREVSVTEVSGDPGALAAIPRRNIDRLRELGRAAILARLEAARRQTLKASRSFIAEEEAVMPGEPVDHRPSVAEQKAIRRQAKLVGVKVLEEHPYAGIVVMLMPHRPEPTPQYLALNVAEGELAEWETLHALLGKHLALARAGLGIDGQPRLAEADDD